MNCEHCGNELDNNAIECESCNGNYCSDDIKMTDIGKCCVDCIENLMLEVIDEE